jgi:hypothetical protein
MMNRVQREEARRILAAYMDLYRAKPYVDLLPLLRNPGLHRAFGASGREYHVEVAAVWVDEVRGHLQVYGGIDDGGIAAWFHLRNMLSSFVIRPSGRIAEDRKRRRRWLP